MLNPERTVGEESTHKSVKVINKSAITGLIDRNSESQNGKVTFLEQENIGNGYLLRFTMIGSHGPTIVDTGEVHRTGLGHVWYVHCACKPEKPKTKYEVPRTCVNEIWSNLELNQLTFN